MVEILSAPSDLESKYIPGSRLTTETEILTMEPAILAFMLSRFEPIDMVPKLPYSQFIYAGTDDLWRTTSKVYEHSILLSLLGYFRHRQLGLRESERRLLIQQTVPATSRAVTARHGSETHQGSV